MNVGFDPLTARSLRVSFLWAFVAGFMPPAWADPPVGGIAVKVPVEDAAGRTVALDGMLWLPGGKARAAVVFANGSGGWRDYREGQYGRTLAAAGYAALAIDSFGARGITDTVTDQSQLSIVQMVRDELAGKNLLVARGIEGDRIAIMGWSRGGAVALAAADGNFLAQERSRFRVAIAFYPACNFRPRIAKPMSVVFMGLGDRDNYTGVKPCQDIADDYGKAGGTISVKVYADSTHAFDGNPASTRASRDFMAETFINCVFVVAADGTADFQGQQFDLDHGFRDLVIYARRQRCAGKGATMWTNLRQKEEARRDVLEFLNTNL